MPKQTETAPAEVPQDNPLVLQYQLDYVKQVLNSASQRKARLEDLMSRREAKKWNASKKATMVRRLVAATQTVEQAVAATDELVKKLEEVVAKLGGPAKVHSVAPSPNAEVPAALFDAPSVASPFGS